MKPQRERLQNFRKAVDAGLRETQRMGLSRRHQANMFGWRISRPSDFPEWKTEVKRIPNVDVTDRLLLIRKIYSELDFSAKTPQQKRRELAKPQEVLGGHSLLEFIKNGHMHNLQLVTDFLEQQGVE